MNKYPLVSVIMAIYNTPKEYVYDAVKSILNQTYSNFEFIIVNDGSNKDFVYNFASFNDKRIKYISYKKNQGVSAARNIGLNNSSGKYIAIIDSDDIAFKSRLQKQVDFLETHEDVVACGTWFKFFGGKNHERHIVISNQEYYRACLLFDNSPTILNPSVMIKKDIIISHNLKYDEGLSMGEDYMFWVLLSEYGKIVNLPEVLMKYRIHNGQSTSIGVFEKAKKTIKVKRYILNKLNLDFTDEEILAFTITQKKYKNIVLAFECINKIIIANSHSHYFDQDMLILRCDEQKKHIIKMCRNPFILCRLLLSKQLGSFTRQIIKNKL